MTDGQWLLTLLGAIYLSECLVWLPKGAIAVIHTWRGRPIVRTAPQWSSNDRGGLAFTTWMPARAVFVCNGSSFDVEAIRRTLKSVAQSTKTLRVLAWGLFVITFAVAPAVWHRSPLIVIAVIALGNMIVAIAFARTQQDKWFRWTHALAMVVATPAAIRAVDYATRNALRELDPLAVTATVLGKEHAIVRQMLRELAYPAGGGGQSPRFEAARRAGFKHVDQAPDGAAAYCPRCLASYEAGRELCADCDVPLRNVTRAATS